MQQPGRRFEALAWLAPALLLALALAQLALAFGAQLSPWKGGGFGMFATNDHGAFRMVRAFSLAGGGEARVPIPDELDRVRRHARELPREANLLALARALRERDPALGRLRVEVWRTEFSRQDLSPSARKIAQALLE